MLYIIFIFAFSVIIAYIIIRRDFMEELERPLEYYKQTKYSNYAVSEYGNIINIVI